MASLRNLPEQFAAGADVSASRIEANLDALFAELNTLKPGKKYRRFVETHLVTGYTPARDPSPISLPWLKAFNDSTNAATLEPPSAYTNPYRHKAAWNASINSEPTFTVGEQVIWEVSFSTSAPVILKNITATLRTDTDYPNGFVWRAAPPPNKVVGEPVDDMSIQLIIDSAMQTEDRKQSSVEVLSTNIKLDRYKVSTLTVNPLWDTMQPAHPQAPTNGVMIEIPALVHIPARARCRLQIILPKYEMPDALLYSDWDQYPWLQQGWTAQVTLLEPEE